MSCACLFAVKHAVEEARAEIGQGADYFVMSEYKLGFFTSWNTSSQLLLKSFEQ